MTKEDKKIKECMRRMDVLRFSQSVIDEFHKEGIIYEYNYVLNRFVKADENLIKDIKKLEEEYDLKVYYVLHSNSNIGETREYFFVSSYPEEWTDDRLHLEMGQTQSFVDNLTYPENSEFGFIGFEECKKNKLRRIW